MTLVNILNSFISISRSMSELVTSKSSTNIKIIESRVLKINNIEYLFQS